MSLGSPKKRKTVGPFKSLKKSILRTKGTNSQILDKDQNDTKTAINVNRQSIQRITLFEYENVMVRTWNSDDPRSINVISNKISFEVYEIYMLRSRQRMNYLCLGKKDQFVHPIMPKLKVQRVTSDSSKELKIVICLFNPDRFWEVTFLSNGVLPRNVIEAFEDTISKICRYTTCKSDPLSERSPEAHRYVSIRGDQSNIIKEEEEDEINETSNEHADSDDDITDLEYLLEDSIEEQDDVIEDFASSSNSMSLNESSTISTPSVDHDFVAPGEVINKTFKQALGRIKPFDASGRANSSRYKRFSSVNTTFLDSGSLHNKSFTNPIEKRRSISVPMELNNSFDYEKLKRVSWMDISFEDIKEV